MAAAVWKITSMGVPVASEIHIYTRGTSCDPCTWTDIYTITADDIPDNDSLDRPFMQSPEPFAADDNSYIAFVVGDEQGFSSITDGRIYYAKIDPGANAATDFVRVDHRNSETAQTIIEPEVDLSPNGIA